MSNAKAPAFFSYARKDAEIAHRLAADLKKSGAHVWLDQLDIRPGRQWDREVEQALDACHEMLVVLSPSATDSSNVMDEVSFALEQRKTVIPILVQDCRIPFRLRRIQYVDFRSDYHDGLSRLLNVLIVDYQESPVEREPADAGRIAREQADAARQAEADRIAREQAAAAQQAESDRIAREQADAARQAEADRIAREQAAAAQQAESDRIAREQAAAARQAEADRIAREQADAARQAEADRIAREQAEAAHRAEADRIAREQTHAARRVAQEPPAQQPAGLAPNLPGPIYPALRLALSRKPLWFALAASKDPDQARRWFEASAAGGDDGAMAALGDIYRNGAGVDRDLAQARYWYEKAAAKGHNLAMATLGFIYESGDGVPVDYAQARDWYHKAAAAGNADARQHLARLGIDNP